MREASSDDFFIDLPKVGTFRYARRTVGDRLAIRRDYLRYTQEFGDDDPDLSLYAALIATHSILCVEAPEGWDNIAALSASKLDKAFELGVLLKDKEETFLKVPVESGSVEGEGSGGDGGVSVPQDLRTAAAGSSVSGDDNGGHAR